MSNWYKTGFDSLKDERDRMESKYGVDRFFMKPKTQASVVFMDDEPFTYHEHSYKKDGDWNNITCIAGVNPEKPRCCEKLGEQSRYFVGMLTVVDCTPYPSKNDPNKVYQYGVKLFPAKYKALNVLGRKRQAHTTLVNTKCAIARDTDKDPNTGNDFTFTEEVKSLDAMFGVANFKGKLLTELWDKADADPEEFRKLARIFQLAKGADGKLVRRVPPFNYASLLEPKTPEEVVRMLSGNVMGSNFNDKKPAAGGGGGGSSTPQDAPF